MYVSYTVVDLKSGRCLSKHAFYFGAFVSVLIRSFKTDRNLAINYATVV